MNRMNIKRILGAFALSSIMIFGLSNTAFAYSNENEPITEASLPHEEKTSELSAESKRDVLSEEGNAYAHNLHYDKEANKQFITIQTKKGNTFYIVIDYDAPVKDKEEQYQTYFLNLVDEGDLLALMDENEVDALKTCICRDKCKAGQVNMDCPVCKTNMVECEGVEPIPEPPAEEPEIIEPKPEEPVKKSGAGAVAAILIFAGLGVGAYCYFKLIRRGKQTDEDLDFFDDEGYEEPPYINEDEDNLDDEVTEEAADR